MQKCALQELEKRKQKGKKAFQEYGTNVPSHTALRQQQGMGNHRQSCVADKSILSHFCEPGARMGNRDPGPTAGFPFLPTSGCVLQSQGYHDQLQGPLCFSSLGEFRGKVICEEEWRLAGEETLWNLVEGSNCQCSEWWRDTSVQQPGMKSWHLHTNVEKTVTCQQLKTVGKRIILEFWWLDQGGEKQSEKGTNDCYKGGGMVNCDQMSTSFVFWLASACFSNCGSRKRVGGGSHQHVKLLFKIILKLLYFF